MFHIHQVIQVVPLCCCSRPARSGLARSGARSKARSGLSRSGPARGKSTQHAAQRGTAQLHKRESLWIYSRISVWLLIKHYYGKGKHLRTQGPRLKLANSFTLQTDEWLIDCLTDRGINRLIDWLIGWLIDWWIGCLIDWLLLTNSST